MHRIGRIIAAVAALTGWSTWAPTATAAQAKNVILMISDGAGYNTFQATSMYQGKVGSQPYEQPGWVKLACSTHPLMRYWYASGTGQDAALVYGPQQAWDSNAGEYGYVKGYDYLHMTATDSAAAATALSTGQKTYVGAINWTNSPSDIGTGIIATIAHVARSEGRRVGVVTSVPWSHATPAALGGAHSDSRRNISEIANEMLNSPRLDVIMGCGHPGFDNDGEARTTDPAYWNYQWVGGQETWDRLVAGTHPAGWKLIQTKAEFEGLTGAANPPGKLVGVPQVGSTLQQCRSGWSWDTPYADASVATVPSLQTMTRGALNALGRGTNGFFLMVEGGAVDWANHDNEPGRMIEEQIDFNQAVQAVVDWVDAHSSWDETLVIVTADHETGLIWGPNSGSVPFQPLVDNGPGKVPGMYYNSTGHSSSLVPVYARGPGADLLVGRAVRTDPIRGAYLDNTDVHSAMQSAIPEPATLGLLLTGAIALPRRRRAA